MKLSVAIHELQPRNVFRISRAQRRSVQNVFVRLERDGIAGYGEASPNEFYNETAEDVARRLSEAAPWIAGLEIASKEDVLRACAQSWRRFAPSRAAVCALDLALWDWLGKAQARSVAELVWGEAARPVTSFGTIGISTAEEWEAKMDELAGFERIKLKSDAATGVQPVEKARARFDGMLAVDANCAWPADRAPEWLNECGRHEVEFVEQPLAPGAEASLPPDPRGAPLFADESCVTEMDVPRLAVHYEGVCIKLVKCGGLSPALQMVHHARYWEMRVMIGCMLESSLLIAAGAVAAQQTAYADLDGAWLLGHDPCRGWPMERGQLQPPPALHGLGVTVDIPFPAH